MISPALQDETIEVVVVDSTSVICEGLELILPRYGLRVTGTARTVNDGAQMISARRPQVALVDVRLGRESGMALAARFGRRDLPTHVLLYTGCTDIDLLRAATRSGASGLALKTIGTDELARGIRMVAAGGQFIDANALALLRVDAERPRTLTPRQAEMLSLLAQGLTADEIAARIVLSPATVHKHVQGAISKLGARGRLHAVVLAAQRGEISLDLKAAAHP